MIRLFPRTVVCEWCGGGHPQAQLCSARPGLSRRSFLFLASTAAVAAIVAPKLLLPELPQPLVFPIEIGPNANYLGLPWNQVDELLKQQYLPAIRAQLNSENTILKFMQDEESGARILRDAQRARRRQRFADIARVA